MKKNKNVVKDCFLTFLGIGLVLVGFLFHNKSVSTDKMIATIPYIFITVGCGIFGHFMDNLIKYFSTKNHERNILIAEKSKAKAYDLMIYLFASILLIFSLMGVDKLVIIMIVAIYLSIQIYALYWRSKFESKM